MPAGLEIQNLEGATIITAEHKVLVFSEKGSFTVTSANTDGNGYGTVTFRRPITSSVTPSVFVRYVNGTHATFSAYFRFIGGPGNWTGFTLISAVGGGSQLQNHTLEYVACKYTDSLGPDNYGLQVFDGAGGIVFGSHDRPVKYKKMTKAWTVRSISIIVNEYLSNIPIDASDFICISQFDRGCLFFGQRVAYAGLTLKRDNVLVLNITTNTSNSYAARKGDMLFTIPICSFPNNVYPVI